MNWLGWLMMLFGWSLARDTVYDAYSPLAFAFALVMFSVGVYLVVS